MDVIRSFGNKLTEKIYEGEPVRRFPADVVERAQVKLGYLDAAQSLDDLRQPPGNRLEALKGDRKGQHSIRINTQWRVCFEWTGKDAESVEIVDYH